jgi:GntR family transcriptional regulator / MocR family aminotransferase
MSSAATARETTLRRRSRTTWPQRPAVACAGLPRDGPDRLVCRRTLAASLRSALLAAKAITTLGGSTLEQRALADFIHKGGHFERHVRRSRARNAARRTVLLEAIAEHRGDRVEVSGANAGVHLLLWLRHTAPRQIDTIVRRAAAAGVGVYWVAPFYLKPPQRAGLVLGYASLSERTIRDGIARLARVVA